MKRWVSSILIGCCLLQGLEAADKSKEKPPKWSVAGQGFFKNRVLKNQLNATLTEDKTRFDAADIEDAALILLSDMQGNGYLDAKVQAKIELLDGTIEEVEWDKTFSVFLPRSTEAKRVSFRFVPGPRAYYEELIIDNQSSLEEEAIAEFFYSEPLMFQSHKARVFTPSAMKSGAGNLSAYLNQMGYQEAVVKVDSVDGDVPGSKVVTVSVIEGKLHKLKSIVVHGAEGEFIPEVDTEEYVGIPYSRFLLQDVLRHYRNLYYEAGYPEVVIRSESEYDVESKKRVVDVDLLLEVESGPELMVSDILYEGIEDTRESLVSSKVSFSAGDALNPILLEESRLAIARIGVFGRVDYDLIESGEGTRSVNFKIEEKTPWNLDLLAGWGSYERLRGGVVAEKINVFGLGHRFRLKGLASMKSTFGEVRYSLPQLLNTSTSLSTKVYSLEREEQSFDRRELGVDVGLSRYAKVIGANVDLVYAFESLESLNSTLGNEESLDEDSLVGSFGLRVGRDRRDNPINPRDGYRLFGKLEWASEWFGGNTNYQLGEFGYSHHGEFGRGLYWHFGITGGMIDSYLEDEPQVPTGKLFYMGGENSIRGYTRGEAAKIDGDGKFVGASSYLLTNLEIEQLLSDSLSIVLFLDSLGQVADFSEDTVGEDLHSIGLGLRFKTFMGPIRFEYGHNLNPRPEDSNGAFHFSIGYPF